MREYGTNALSRTAELLCTQGHGTNPGPGRCAEPQSHGLQHRLGKGHQLNTLIFRAMNAPAILL